MTFSIIQMVWTCFWSDFSINENRREKNQKGIEREMIIKRVSTCVNEMES